MFGRSKNPDKTYLSLARIQCLRKVFAGNKKIKEC